MIPKASTPLACCFLAILSFTGCAKPVLELTEPLDEHQLAAQQLLRDGQVGPSRNIAHIDMLPTVDRVLGRVTDAAYEVCVELQLEEPVRCELMATSDVTVYLGERDINAYADQDNNVGIYGGLVSAMGTDAEIAAVLAHEYAHIMYGHVNRKFQNAAVGAALAGMLMAIGQANASEYDAEAVQSAAALGAAVGSRAYSQSMEIEADRTAVYILQRAGYPVTAMRDVVVRMKQEKTRRSQSGLFGGKVGFLQTHPSNEARVAHILSAIEDVNAGVPLQVAR